MSLTILNVPSEQIRHCAIAPVPGIMTEDNSLVQRRADLPRLAANDNQAPRPSSYGESDERNSITKDEQDDASSKHNSEILEEDKRDGKPDNRKVFVK